MDILESKSRFNDKIIYLLKLLKFKNNKIDIKGTASLASQKYFSDYDLFTQINGKINNEKIYNEIKNILDKVKQDSDLYFTELKIQNKKDKKKFFNMDFSKDEFIKNIKDLEYIKIDLIANIEKRFIEISIIYNFSENKMTTEDYIKSIYEDIKELKKEGRFYKILKRIWSINKTNRDNKMLLKLSDFFNSDVGALYQKNSNLEAIEKLIKIYKDDITLKKAFINLKEIREEPNLNTISKTIKDNNKKINKIAKKFIKDEEIKI